MQKTALYFQLTVFLILSSSLLAQDGLKVFEDLKFRNVGPTRGGRATTVTGIPTRPHTFFMGSTGGGVWKTEDYGNTWKNVSDGYFNTPSIGAMRVANSNPDVVYVGTGSDGIRSNVITGKGMYKSTDAGKTWKHIGLEKTGHIGAVEIDPSSPDRVFVAAIGNAFAPNSERGVYRTLDGGKSWKKVLFISDTVGVADLEFAPDNAQTIYAALWRVERKPWTIISGGAVGGIYKSTDGGDTWKQVKKGLPEGTIGKIDLAVSADDPKRLYALVEAPVGKGGLYRSDDRGESFSLVTTKKELLDRPFYYLNVDVNPQNANVVHVNATGYYKSIDGGKSWRRRSTPHGDNHDIWINPLDTLISVQANDGGANVSLNDGKTWSTQRNQPTAELYQIEVDDQFPYWIYAGQQDNSTISVPSLPPYSPPGGATSFWMAVGGCETGPAVPKPGNHNIVYSNCKGRFGVYNKETGQEMQYYVGAGNMYGHNPKDLTYRFQRVSPIHVSPHNPNVVYHASQFLHKTTDDGKTWETVSPDLTAFTPETQVISGSPITRDVTGEEFYSTIYAIRESPVQEGVIWVGANDGPVHVTRNGGKNWDKVTPAGMPLGGRVDCVEPSPHKAGKAYVAVLRYQLGDWEPHIYKTEDFGKSWTRLTDGKNGIPADYPTRVVREDPDREGLLYAGTEFGMFVSMDDGKSWHAFQQNLPVTPITDIKVHRKDLILSTMGRSFWIMDNISPLHQVSDLSSVEKITLFQPRDAHRMRYRGNGANSVPHYPNPGLIIDYYLAEKPDGEVKVEILDSDKNIVQTYSSKKSDKKGSKEEVSMATGFRRGGRRTVLSSKAGQHRLRWDLRHEGAWHKTASRSGLGGPVVSPGTYTVRLQVGKTVREVSAVVKADPRIIKAGLTQADMKKQEDLSLDIRDLLSEARKLENQLDAQIKELKKEIKAEKKDKKQKTLQEKLDQIMTIKSGLTTAEGRYMTPMLVDQLSYLYSMLQRADQRPGKDAYDRYEELKKRFEALSSKEKLLGAR